MCLCVRERGRSEKVCARVPVCKRMPTKDARYCVNRHYFWAVRELGTFLLPFLYFSAVSEFFSVRTCNFYKNVLGKFPKICKVWSHLHLSLSFVCHHPWMEWNYYKNSSKICNISMETSRTNIYKKAESVSGW